MNNTGFKFNDISIETNIIQGGMGIGISNYILAGNVSLNGGLGVLSSVALERLIFDRTGEKLSPREATKKETIDAKKIANNKPIGINIMVAAAGHYNDAVLGAMDGGIDVIISGAGLPIKLPEIVQTHERKDEVALVPIVSSARALNVILRKWKKFGVTPAAVVVEGPLAGGHIGWLEKEIALSENNKLENLVAEVLELANKHNIPVIAAGGLHDNKDIKKMIDLGCSGVQLGTRFLATHESGANAKYKEMIINSVEADIELADKPGSPCHMLFRVLKDSPFYLEAKAKTRKFKCDKGYLLVDGKCPALTSYDSFCICNGLIASSDFKTEEKEIYTVGAKVHLIKEIISVKELMAELTKEV